MDRFADRREAGQRLALRLHDRGVDADVVLAIPRGGLPLGREVADALDLPLDVIVAKKIGAPGNPEYAIGAVGSDGSTWLDEDGIERAGIDDAYVEEQREETAAAAREKAERYRQGGPEPDLEDQRVLIVDDGAATGSTAIAATRLARERGAEHVTVAVPVAPPQTTETLSRETDTVVTLLVPAQFDAVGQFYDSFDQVSDEEAQSYLA